jgi:hypothetical protein
MDEKKQIEKMAKHLTHCFWNCAPCDKCLAYIYSEQLYNAGYREQTEWISVDERLPKKHANFLIADDKGHMEIALWTKRFGWFSDSNSSNSVKKVSYWMPLPEPPDMKGGAE